MTDAWGSLHIEVVDGEIVVMAPFTSYTVTYYKPAKSPQLLARLLVAINRSGMGCLPQDPFLNLGLATSPWSYCLSVDQLIRLSAHSSHGPTNNLIE
jgi:hypothetical protein